MDVVSMKSQKASMYASPSFAIGTSMTFWLVIAIMYSTRFLPSAQRLYVLHLLNTLRIYDAPKEFIFFRCVWPPGLHIWIACISSAAMVNVETQLENKQLIKCTHHHSLATGMDLLRCCVGRTHFSAHGELSPKETYYLSGGL